MKTILEKLLNIVGEDSSIIRVNIREDENYGTAIIQSPNGTPQCWDYNDGTGTWE